MTEHDLTWDCVFLDRDGTINGAPSGRYLIDPEELVLLPGAARAVAALNAADIPVFVVTNQQGLATGAMTTSDLAAVHGRLGTLLAESGAHLDGLYTCPHLAGTCRCRKPADGLLRRVFSDHRDLVPTRCAIVGDAITDVRAGDRLGLHRVLIGSQPVPSDVADATARDLDEAVRGLLFGLSLP